MSLPQHAMVCYGMAAMSSFLPHEMAVWQCFVPVAVVWQARKTGALRPLCGPSALLGLATAELSCGVTGRQSGEEGHRAVTPNVGCRAGQCRTRHSREFPVQWQGRRECKGRMRRSASFFCSFIFGGQDRGQSRTPRPFSRPLLRCLKLQKHGPSDKPSGDDCLQATLSSSEICLLFYPWLFFFCTQLLP